MSDQSQNGAGPQGVMVQVDPGEVTNALLTALLRMAEKGSSAQDTREAAEASKAALAYAQAIVVLDPNLSASGEPLEPQAVLEALRHRNAMELEMLKAENALALERAKPKPAAPTSGKQGGSS